MMTTPALSTTTASTLLLMVLPRLLLCCSASPAAVPAPQTQDLAQHLPRLLRLMLPVRPPHHNQQQHPAELKDSAIWNGEHPEGSLTDYPAEEVLEGPFETDGKVWQYLTAPPSPPSSSYLLPARPRRLPNSPYTPLDRRIRQTNLGSHAMCQLNSNDCPKELFRREESKKSSYSVGSSPRGSWEPLLRWVALMARAQEYENSRV